MKESDVQLTHFVRDHILVESSNHEASVPGIAAKEKKVRDPKMANHFLIHSREYIVIISLARGDREPAKCIP